MHEMPNHKTRRQIAKRLGLLKKRRELPFKKYCEEITRSQAAGKELHRMNTEEMLRSIEAQEIAIYEGKSTPTKKQNQNAQKILDQMTVLGEKRSYNEIAADMELAAWVKRYIG